MNELSDQDFINSKKYRSYMTFRSQFRDLCSPNSSFNLHQSNRTLIGALKNEHFEPLYLPLKIGLLLYSNKSSQKNILNKLNLSLSLKKELVLKQVLKEWHKVVSSYTHKWTRDLEENKVEHVTCLIRDNRYNPKMVNQVLYFSQKHAYISFDSLFKEFLQGIVISPFDPSHKNIPSKIRSGIQDNVLDLFKSSKGIEDFWNTVLKEIEFEHEFLIQKREVEDDNPESFNSRGLEVLIPGKNGYVLIKKEQTIQPFSYRINTIKSFPRSLIDSMKNLISEPLGSHFNEPKRDFFSYYTKFLEVYKEKPLISKRIESIVYGLSEISDFQKTIGKMVLMLSQKYPDKNLKQILLDRNPLAIPNEWLVDAISYYKVKIEEAEELRLSFIITPPYPHRKFNAETIYKELRHRALASENEKIKLKGIFSGV